jgi:hypothetical protein
MVFPENLCCGYPLFARGFARNNTALSRRIYSGAMSRT